MAEQPLAAERIGNSQLPTLTLVLGLCGYPLFATASIWSSLPTLVVSLSVRVVVAVLAVASIVRIGRLQVRPWSLLVVLIWSLLLIRLTADMEVGIPDSGHDLAFFVLAILVPGLSFMAPGVRVRESELAMALVVVCMAIALSGLASVFLPGTADRSLLGETGRLSFDAINPITLGHMGATGIIAACIAMYNRRLSALVGLLCVGTMGALLVLSASRGPMVALAIAIVCWLLSGKVGLRSILLVACVLGGVVALFLFSDPESAFSQRFAGVADDQSTFERITMQLDAIDQFIEHPVLGSAHVEVNSGTYPHNPFVESAMSLGVAGLLIYTTLAVMSILKARRNLRAGDRLVTLLFLQYFVGAQFSGALFGSVEYWMLMVLLFSMDGRADRIKEYHELRETGPGSIRSIPSAKLLC